MEDRIGIELLEIPTLLGPQPRAKRTSVLAISLLGRSATSPEIARTSRLRLGFQVALPVRRRSVSLTTDRTMGALAARWQGHPVRPVGFFSTLWCIPPTGRGWPKIKLISRPYSRNSCRLGPVANEFRIRDLLWLSEIVQKVEAFRDERERPRVASIGSGSSPRDDPELRPALEDDSAGTRIMDRRCCGGCGKSHEHANEGGRDGGSETRWSRASPNP